MKQIKKTLFIAVAVILTFSAHHNVEAAEFSYSGYKNIGVYACEAATGRVLIDNNSDTKYAPASITKVLTILTALDYLEMGSKVSVTKEILNLVESDSSVAGLVSGENLTFEQSIYALMLPSGNEAAKAVAVAAGKKILGDDNASVTNAYDAFVRQMNVKAKIIGMKDSNFINPDGYPYAEQYSTAKDLVALGTQALGSSEIMKAAATKAITIETNKKTHYWVNGNWLLHKDFSAFKSSELKGKNANYNSYATGLKTGNAGNEGGMSLLFTSSSKEMTIVGAVMHVESKSRSTLFNKANAVTTFTYANYTVTSLINDENRSKTFKVKNHALFSKSSLTLLAADNGTFCLEKDLADGLEIVILPNEEFADLNNGVLTLRKDIRSGDIVASGIFMKDSEHVASVDFIAGEDFHKSTAVQYILLICAALIILVFIRLAAANKRKKRKRRKINGRKALQKS